RVWGTLRCQEPTADSMDAAKARLPLRSPPQTTTSSPLRRRAMAVAKSISTPRSTAPAGPASRSASWMTGHGVGGRGTETEASAIGSFYVVEFHGERLAP